MSYANRGMVTEEIVEISCSQYEDRNLAVIRKVPTSVKVLKLVRGRIRDGFFEKKGTVDFEGTIKGGRSIAFDSKETKGKSLPFGNITNEQISYMESVSKMGGSAFILVCFSQLDKYYRLDIKDIVGYMNEPWASNKKSFPLKFLEQYGTEVKSRNGMYLDFLEGIGQ